MPGHHPIFKSDALGFNPLKYLYFLRQIHFFLKEYTKKWVLNNTRPCISQYNPNGVYRLVQALGMYCVIHTPDYLLRECTEHLVLAHSAIRRQAQTRASVRMHLVRAYTILSPFRTRICIFVIPI